jgi:hypothetical protein
MPGESSRVPSRQPTKGSLSDEVTDIQPQD